MPITLDGTNGITTPTYGGADTSEYLVPVTGFKNRIINGAMVIDQRNAGASVTPSADPTYTLDRWVFQLSQASKFSVQQNAGSVTPPSGFKNYLGITVGASANVTVGTSDYFLVQQKIEGFNTSDLDFGTANAKTITISFWVRSSLTGTFGGALRNSAENRSYPFTYTISAANTWEQKSVTIAGDTSGTWVGATNGIGLTVNWSLGVGSTYTGTAGTWAGTNYANATGSVNLITTNSATFYITGVQLEVGSTATSFDYRPYGTELALCQRYCYQINSDNSGNGGGTGLSGVGTGATSGGLSRCQAPIPQMRAIPSITVSNVSTNGTDLRVWNGATVTNVTGGVTNYSSINAVQFDANTGVSYTAGNALSVLWQNSINNGFIRLTAEL